MTKKILTRADVFIIFLCMLFVFLTCDKHNLVSSDSRYPEAALQNFDVLQLSQAIDDLAQIPGDKSIVVGRNGVIAAEGYCNNSGAGITISPHTMFAIGNLVLDRGRWNQNKIVLKDWVTLCISNQNKTHVTFPYVTPDRNYLFFISGKPGDPGYNTYWLDAQIIENYRMTNME